MNDPVNERLKAHARLGVFRRQLRRALGTPDEKRARKALARAEIREAPVFAATGGPPNSLQRGGTAPLSVEEKT